MPQKKQKKPPVQIHKDGDKLTYARDCKCCQCGKRAVCFWPIIDPDIPSSPYCRKCVDNAKMRVLMEMQKVNEEYDQKKKK